MHAKPTRGTLALALFPLAAQAFDQERRIGQGGRLVEQLVQQLVVAGARQVEPLADLLLFVSGGRPPGLLEIEDGGVSRAELPHLERHGIGHAPTLDRNYTCVIRLQGSLLDVHPISGNPHRDRPGRRG